jgi:hypothetical protein
MEFRYDILIYKEYEERSKKKESELRKRPTLNRASTSCHGVCKEVAEPNG